MFKAIKSKFLSFFSCREKTWTKDQLLIPLLHKRYITLYCIADLEDGRVPIKTSSGDVIGSISAYSKKRLDMEGTGRLPDGRVVNVGLYNNGWTYIVMGPDSPDGVGIKGAALKPWFSLAHNLPQLNKYKLFGRTVVIPALRGYKTPDGKTLDGVFEVHDIGGGLRMCLYERGLWRTGSSKATYGQFDMFMGGPESIYNQLLHTWPTYFEVFVMPRDLTSISGQQEALNLLMDAGLVVDGITGPKTKEAVNKIKEKTGLKQGGTWSEDLNRYVKLSLDNW